MVLSILSPRTWHFRKKWQIARMKPLQIIACFLSLSLISSLSAAPPSTFGLQPPVTPAAPPAELLQLIEEGKTAYGKGDIAGAKSAFEMAYQMDSRNTVAIGYLRKIKEIEKTGLPRTEPLEKQLAGVVIPQINFRDATLGSALEYLRNAVKRQTNGRLAVNFVVQLPTEQVNTQTVTLSLNNVPFNDALHYLGTVASLKFDFQKYAIVVKPEGTAAPAPAPTAIAPTVPPVPGLPGQ